MFSKSQVSLPLIVSPRLAETDRIMNKGRSLYSNKEDSADRLFMIKSKSHHKRDSGNNSIFNLNPADARMEFFTSMKVIHKKELKAVSDNGRNAYLTECQKNRLNPIPLSFAKPTMSSINLSNFSMGDNYAAAFAKGLNKAKNLEVLNIGANSLSPRGTHQIISQITSKTLQELNLKNNKIDLQSIIPIIKLIQKRNSLKYLNLENTSICDGQVVQICDTLNTNNSLTFLGLALNSLGQIAAFAIKKMLEENSTLKKLDLHWNNFKDMGSALIFEGLTKNDSLKELDLSWNSIGQSNDKKGLLKLSALIPSAQGLKHLDLSFNSFTIEECEILSKGLNENHTILGLHFMGNDGHVDAEGFLLGKSKSLMINESHLYTRLFEESKLMLKKRQKVKSNCWICENWTETSIVIDPVAFGLSLESQIFIHIECDEYDPDIMIEENGNMCITRMLPHGENKFFFSHNNSPMRYNEFHMIDLIRPVGVNKSYSEDNSFNVSTLAVNKKNVTSTTFDYGSRFKVIPRKEKFWFKKFVVEVEKEPWDVRKSIFKDYRFLDEKLIEECLEFDWDQSRLPNWLKSQDHEAMKEVLKKSYKQIMETFRYLGSQSSNELLAVGSNIITEFLYKCKLIDDLYQVSYLGVNWNAVNNPKEKRQAFNPWNALVRYEFVELLIRIAHERYVKSKICETIPEGFSRMIDENLLKVLSINDSNTWRFHEYINEDIDTILTSNKQVLLNIYKKYSGRKSLPGQKPFMSIEEFRQLCYDANLVPKDKPIREIDICFSQSMMMQADEVNQKKHVEMTFVEFIEALCRVSSYFYQKGQDEGIESDSEEENDLDYDESVIARMRLKRNVRKTVRSLYPLVPRNTCDYNS